MSRDETKPNLDEVLEVASPERREVLRKLVVGTAYAVPVIASFSVADVASGQIGSEGGTGGPGSGVSCFTSSFTTTTTQTTSPFNSTSFFTTTSFCTTSTIDM